MNIEPSRKMSIFEPAIFGDLKAAAAAKQAAGYEVYDLSLGSPDLPPDEKIRKVLSEQSFSEHSYGYMLTGTKRFNEAVANYYKRRVNVTLNPQTEILQTMGSQEGLVHLPIAFCNEGDIVLTTNPGYVAYDAGIKLAGAVPYYMNLTEENGYLPDLAAIPEEVAYKAKLMILNLPGNPVPAMPNHAFFEKVVAFANKYNVIILHDAAYSEFYFSGDTPSSFLTTPGAMEVGMEINSLSKSFSLAGTRIAYLVGNAEMISIMKQLKSNLDFGIFSPIQEAGITALNNAEEITDRLRQLFAERHKVLMQGIMDLGWTVAPSNGGMFVWAKYPYDMDDKEFAFEVIRQTGVVTVPGTVFGSEGAGFVRLALVQDVETLKKAVEQLKTLNLETCATLVNN
ncbi:aminotransferase class I/II-fold pyridoxal phosphate-dependent enzyme [Psychrobacillus lasiicapitis]|uniref:Aminotransferase n=1 Tax=Psychrobacillus lasiicapitis TaxID=1636719 RepID=A0A544T4U9_9BACI|nr:aminotransferase class I/II-fold pyridoxal phosphate-dependent enzyme [Psychrobacillus lasiicapitis]TQR12483.1 aminotransferase class I/II-fold pyridoxal phosphate-dependent enzyme [Psychrobacillus lasiicapitis]GGA38503.1 aminotransferase [Psychrobacillus lasiicapitis]